MGGRYDEQGEGDEEEEEADADADAEEEEGRNLIGMILFLVCPV